MKYINMIDKNNKKDAILLVGKGPSIDNLDLKWINKQEQFDIMAISETCKLFKKPKFGIHYHILTVKRSEKALLTPEHVLFNESFLSDGSFTNIVNPEKTPNAYFFKSHHIKMPQIIKKQFDLYPKDTLFNFSGTVVGAVNFLCGYMGYKKIYYIGFDGGTAPGHAEYSKVLYIKRKESKIEGCKIKYAESWQGTLQLLKYYPGVEFLPLEKFLKKEKRNEN